MSIVNRLEQTYLNVLRVVILTIASALLIVSLVAGTFGMLGVTSFSDSNVKPGKVSTDDVIQELLPQHKAEAAKPKNTEPEKAKEDPYSKQLGKLADMIGAFINKHGAAAGEKAPERDRLIEVFKGRVDAYSEPEIATSYVDGLVDAYEKSLNHEGVLNRVKNESPIGVVNQILEKFTILFNEKLRKAEMENNKKLAEKIANSAASMMKLYVAAGAFVLFLLVVFVSILVKIERNLRVMADSVR